MIIEPTQQTVNGVTFNNLTYSQDFWACGYTPDNIVRLITTEEGSLQANTTTSSKFDGFGATTYQELLDEIANRGLTLQEGLL